MANGNSGPPFRARFPGTRKNQSRLLQEHGVDGMTSALMTIEEQKMRICQASKWIGFMIFAAASCVSASGPVSAQPPSPANLTPDDRAQIDKELKQLQDSLAAIAAPASAEKSDLRADAEIFIKGVTWA